jgi:hypothetical protein
MENIEELFRTLQNLGYADQMVVGDDEHPYGGSAAHYIVNHYRDHGCLNECKLVKHEDMKHLSKYYRAEPKKSILRDIFGFGCGGASGIACSG